jgi:hypothetical protein
VAQAEGVTYRSFFAVEADRGAVDVDLAAAEGEGAGVEAVPPHRGADGGLTAGPGQGDVEERGDLVGQAVTGQRGGEAQGRLGCPGCDLQEVRIAGAVGPPEEPPAELLDLSAVSHGVEPAVGDPQPDCFAVGEDIRQFNRRHVEIVAR